MAVRFVRQEGGQLYFADCGNGALDKLVAYLLPEDDPNDLGEISFADSWQKYAGYYVFLNADLTNQQEALFVEAARVYLSEPSRNGTRFAWFDSVKDVSRLSAHILQVARSGDGNYYTSELMPFNFRNYTLVIARGCAIKALFDTGQFEIDQPTGDPAGIYLQTQWGAFNLPVVGPAVYLPLCGTEAGCFQFQVTLRQADFQSNLLDLGLRFFFNDPTSTDAGYLTSLRYPVFKLTDENPTVSLMASLFPLDALDERRTFFSFTRQAGNAETAAQVAVMDSYFRTNTGQHLSLTPGEDSGIVFSVNPSTIEPDVNDPLYLTPAGAFSLGLLDLPGGPLRSAATSGPALRMIGGVSGVEYFGLAVEEGNVLHFFPGQNAYSPSYALANPEQSSTALIGGRDLLTGVARTSWAYVTPPQGQTIRYFAQPDDSVWYRPGGPDPIFLNYLEVSSGELPQQLTAPSSSTESAERQAEPTPTAFPMTPYSGVRGEIEESLLDDFRQFELQVLSPARRNVIYDLTRGAQAAAESAATTATETMQGVKPQGFLGTFDSSLQVWEDLTLAQTNDGAQQFKLANITGALKAALQTNQLFLVAASKELFLKYCSVVQAVLKIGDWVFDLSPESWDEHKTILIFKFYGKSLESLVADRATWTFPDDFNDNVVEVQAEIQKIIEDAKEKGETESDFRYFLDEIVSNPAWNGILLLRSRVPINQLPPQMAGIAAGVNPAMFYAHHLGINLTPIENDATALKLANSSLFGLIYYDDPEDLFYGGEEYDFKVLSLKVLFQNSVVTSFSSQVELMINKLFAEPSMQFYSQHGNNLLLNGVYQKQGEHESYLFIHQGETLYKISSQVLDSIVVTKAQLITVVAPGAAKPGELAKSRFVLWGNLRFKQLERFDVFSFGPIYDQDDQLLFDGKLNFSNLAVDMSYPPESGEGQKKIFNFDAAQITFDMARSEARPDSLFSHFPMKLAGLVQAKEKTTPSSLGYLAVASPLTESVLAFPWFGLQFELNLGSPGALAAKVGFNAVLLVAWGPNPNEYAVFIGIQLPGATGAKKELSIESVIKLSVKNIEFVVTEGTAYMLKFSNIALKFLSISFPPYGQTDVLLFGDPYNRNNTMLGWYAAYAKQKPVKPQQSSPPGGTKLLKE